MRLQLAQNATADALISEDPLALLIGMVLDQQVPLERAFSSPADLKARLGGRLDAAEMAAMDPDRLAGVFAARPALHRFPAANAKRVQALCQHLLERYGANPEEVWTTATSGEGLLARAMALPGFGKQKAQIFVALLGKQLGVRPPGWEQAAGRFGQPGSRLSVADITDAASLEAVRAYKRQVKAGHAAP